MHSIRASGDKIRLLCAFLKLNKFFEFFEKSRKIEEKIDLRRKTFLRANFFDFSKNLFNSKNAQRSRILSPEALIECVRKVFIYSLLLKRKKYSWSFWTHRIRICLEHKNTFFQEIPYWLHITYQINDQPPK